MIAPDTGSISVAAKKRNTGTGEISLVPDAEIPAAEMVF
jgi:hypothetical protein